MNEPMPKPTKHRIPRSAIATSVSFAIHFVATVVLSLIVIGQHGKGAYGILLSGSQSASDADLELQQMQVASKVSIEPVDEAPPGEFQASETPAAHPKPSTVASPEIASAPGISSDAFAVTSIAAMLGGGFDDGDGGGSSSTANAASGASGSESTFFGTKVVGHRIVFVIDSSSSMIGPRWEALRRELNRALRSLSPDQEFFVISFDFAAHPMFDALPPKSGFLKPTQENIQRLNYWVASIEHGRDTLPASAIGIALRLEPDSIFLLSDGEIRDATLYDLRTYNRKEDKDGNLKVRIPIHTVLLHSDAGFMTLKAIADENDGVFTPVNIFALGFR